MGILVCGLLKTSTAHVVPEVRNSPNGLCHTARARFTPESELVFICAFAAAAVVLGRVVVVAAALGKASFRGLPARRELQSQEVPNWLPFKRTPKRVICFWIHSASNLGRRHLTFLGLLLQPGPSFGNVKYATAGFAPNNLLPNHKQSHQSQLGTNTNSQHWAANAPLPMSLKHQDGIMMKTRTGHLKVTRQSASDAREGIAEMEGGGVRQVSSQGVAN